MAQRTITSAGTEIRERDLSLRVPQTIGTTVYATGFARQGPIDEVIKVSTKSEAVQIYGTPSNAPERYFMHTVFELLNSPANVYVNRLPYGSGLGDGFGSKFSALVYPATAFGANNSGQSLDITLTSTSSSLSSATYVLGAPTHIELTEAQYRDALEGTLFDWSSAGSTQTTFVGSALSDIGKAGVIILNKAQTTVNGQFEGYYVGLADNTNLNPATNYDGILNVKTITTSFSTQSSFTTIPKATLQFNLSADYQTGPSNSISEIMEKLTNYDIDGREDDDVLNVGVFKLRKSINATQAFKLDAVLEDAIVGSVDSHRQQLDPQGGLPVPFFLEATDNKSRNVEILVNPYISNKNGNPAQGPDGNPLKKVRLMTTQLLTLTSADVLGVSRSTLQSVSASMGLADSLYSLGAFSDMAITNKLVGDIPSKVERSLDAVRNDEVYDIDVVVEGGLGTIYAVTSAAATSYYDDTANSTTLQTAIDALRTSGDLDATGTAVRANYSTIFNKFEQFCSPPHIGGGRGDCIFIADPIRHIFVTGKNAKILSDGTKNFQQHVYWPIRHQFELENTSYATAYANWVQVYDEYSGEKVWIPSSGFGAAAMARTDAAEFPWSAPAGFTRGLLSFNAVDLAVAPNQKQRDELYKSGFNPITFFPSQGLVIYGQKTLLRKPSAFDRINVRRLFLALERPTKRACQFFVFEPNNEFTRTRIINTLVPLFERAKNNGGLYDYALICDERNNTPEVIDNNELVIDIFLKSTRTCEFILVNFIATRTDTNFQEVINA